MSSTTPRSLIIATLLLSFFLSANSSAMSNLSTGTQANISAFTGNGHWTIVQAWKSSCAICNAEMPEFTKNIHRLPNTKVIGVSLDGNKKIAQNFINKHHVNFPTLLSNTGEFDQYLRRVASEGLTGTPTYLIFNPKGELVALQPGHASFGAISHIIRNTH